SGTAVVWTKGAPPPAAKPAPAAPPPSSVPQSPPARPPTSAAPAAPPPSASTAPSSAPIFGMVEADGGGPLGGHLGGPRVRVPEDCVDICAAGRGCLGGTKNAIADCDAFCDGTKDPMPRYGCIALHHEDCKALAACMAGSGKR